MMPLGLLLVLFVSVQSQPLTVTWRGNNITGIPTLIYFDEVQTVMYSPPPTLSNPNGPRGLLCSSTVGPIAWYPGDGTSTDFDSNRDGILIYQIIPSGNLMAQIVNDGRSASDADVSGSPYHNGLFTCRRNGAISTAVPVGFYQRGGRTARGVITRPVVSVTSSSFFAASPSFTLAGDTERGPPETYTWTKNGVPITNGGSFSIFIGVNGETDPSAYDNSRYRSTLTVTGRLPGVYQYSVSNRATSNTLTSNITIEGAPVAPANLSATQNGIDTGLVSWTAPSPPPSMGYRITVDSTDFAGGIDAASSATSRRIILQPGVHSIRIRALSQHYPSEIVGPVEVTVKDFMVPTIMSSSLTTTSVTITWSQPDGSLAADNYIISLHRLTNSNRTLCTTSTDNQTAMTTSAVTSMNFTDLMEFTIYSVIVTARVFGMSRTSRVEFTTLPAAPTGTPQDIISLVTPRSVSVSWNEIECIERNGMITNYTVEFSSLGGSVIPGVLMVNERRFIASGLTPFTNYTFRVAGVNSIGTGPFSDLITIQTDEDTPGPVSNLEDKMEFTSVDITWSAPINPNGVILGYEITYTVNDSDPVTFNNNASNASTISDLAPGTRMSVLVRAYTSVGLGDDSSIITTTLSEPPLVMNVRVEELTSTSVRVSWDRIDIMEITSYTVYYSATGNRRNEQSVTVSSSQNSVVIGNLMSNVEYKFQVVAVALLYGDVRVVGQRSVSTCSNLSAGTYIRDILIAVAVSVFLTLVLNNTILCTLHHVCNKHGKKKNDQKLEMKSCVAYKDVTASQSSPHKAPQQSKNVYDNPDVGTVSDDDAESLYDNI